MKQEIYRLERFLDKYEEIGRNNQQPGKKRRRRTRRKRKRPYWYDDGNELPPDQEPPVPTSVTRKPVICYRCGDEGHIAIGRRLRLDHSRQAYNFQQINAEDRTFAYQK